MVYNAPMTPPTADPLILDQDDPLPLSVIQRRLKAGTTIHFVRRGLPAGEVTDVRKASVGGLVRLPCPGFYVLEHSIELVSASARTLRTTVIDQETLSFGEASHNLKFRSNADGSITVNLT